MNGEKPLNIQLQPQRQGMREFFHHSRTSRTLQMTLETFKGENGHSTSTNILADQTH